MYNNEDHRADFFSKSLSDVKLGFVMTNVTREQSARCLASSSCLSC